MGCNTRMANNYDELRQNLQNKRDELNARLERITANLRRGFESDSKEMAKQLEDQDVVDALGNEARDELARISATLKLIDDGEYGLCGECGLPIAVNRLKAYPYATECIDCAEMDELIRARS